MNLINNNPYRILALPITANVKEIARQVNTLATFADMGKINLKAFDTDFPFLPAADRSSTAIAEAKKQIDQSDGKLLYSLFWFWKNNSVDELAFEILKEGNTEKALGIWEKASFTNKHKIYKPIVLNENLIISSSHFDDTDDESHLLKKNVDEYIVERKKEENYSIPTAFYELNFDDNWSIECDAKWLAGVDNVSYGIVFGRAKGSYYFFGIAGNGSYMYGKYDDWTYTKYIDWKENKNFNKWSTNNLRIEKIDATLKFFINNEYVDSWQAEPFYGLYFGFKVSNNQKISFRNFKFSKLVENEIYGEGLNVSAKNFSNIKNLSTLYLGLSLASTKGTFKIHHFKKGIALAKNIFANGNMEEFSKLIVDDKYNYSPEKALHFYINDILESIKPFLDKADGISTSELISSFATFPIEAKHFINNRFVVKQIQSIDKEIEIAKTERKKSAGTATEAGKTLANNTKADLNYLSKTLGEGDFQYQTIADKLSLAIIQCGIDAFNFCKTSNGEIDYPNAIRSEEGYIHEYEYAFSIAFTQRARDRAKENLDSCKQYIENKHYYNCWFCGNNSPDKHSSFYKTMYKENSRTGFLVGHRSVQYSYNDFEIPRCESCEQIHSSGTDTYVYIKVGGGILGVVVGLIIDSSSAGGFFLGLVLGVFVGWLIAEGLKNQKLSKSNIKGTDQSTIQNHPLINRLVKEGWQFSKPSA